VSDTAKIKSAMIRVEDKMRALPCAIIIFRMIESFEGNPAQAPA